MGIIQETFVFDFCHKKKQNLKINGMKMKGKK